ncbi:hypothetical protein [Croceicoccus sediminis]|uniref:hypothetical protein n=1 Tax=Croceicoccus sediminis TaxID=2571150 RepID=UPI0011845C7E|nr:hypothetical protein [Croceicoccus sediminis]
MVFASQLFATEEEERRFRLKVEMMLREGKPDQALAAVDARLAEIAERPFAALALSLAPEDVAITGWDKLAATIDSLDMHGQPISAIGIDFCNPDQFDNKPDDGMNLHPVLETAYYCDEVFAFSASDRAAINAAYGRAGPRWRGGFDHNDHEIGVTGLDAIYGRYHAVLPHLEAGELTELPDYDAPRLSAMRTAVLLHMAVARAVEEKGLPRAMVVLVGSNDDYPWFDAPVTTRAEYEEATDAQAESGDTDEALFTSLATLAPVRPNAGYRFTPETDHVSGRSLRHKLVREAEEASADVADAVVAVEANERTSLFGRLFRRSA